MKDLQAVIKTLSKKEVKFISDYYKNNDKQLRLVLFKGILSGKLDTDNKATIKIYKGKNSAYSHLKKRLKKDLLNLLLFFEEDTKNSSAVIKAEIEVDRLLIQARLLQRRRATNYAIKLLKEAFDLCIKYELVKQKVIITYWYGVISGFLNGLSVFEEINKNLIEDSKLLTNYLIVVKERNKIGFFSKSKSNIDKSTFYKNSYLISKEVFNKTTSKNIAYHYYSTAIRYYEHIKDYQTIYDLSVKLNSLILNNIELNNVVYLVNSYLFLFNATLNLKQYEKSTQYALRSYNLISNSKLKNSQNNLIVLGYIFLSNLRENDPSNLLKYLKNGFSHPKIDSSIKSKEKWCFYESAYYFKIQEFDKSLDSLYKINSLLNDKSDWIFTFKLLEIMCYIELEEFDMVHFRIDTFRKLLSKTEHGKIRIKTIYKILKNLLKNGFQFSKVAKIQKENLSLLKNGEGDYYWDPIGFELMRFDDWFYSHL